MPPSLSPSLCPLQPFFQDFAIPSLLHTILAHLLVPNCCQPASEIPLWLHSAYSLKPSKLVADTRKEKPHRFHTGLWLNPGSSLASHPLAYHAVPPPCLCPVSRTHSCLSSLANTSRSSLNVTSSWKPFWDTSLEAATPVFVPPLPWLLLKRLTACLCF